MKSYPLAKPTIGRNEERAVRRVLRSGVLSLGSELAEFERRFARFVGTRYACAVSSGTAGLHLALRAAGIGAGDEVITTPFSFVASANAILYVGATPVFVDIDPMTYNINPAKIEERITRKTKAILVVHIFGQTADMHSIMALARKHRLKVIEDACESVGATYRGDMAGTFGESAVFAFYPNKQLTTGEGGMIVTNRKAHDELFRSLRNQGRGRDKRWLSHERLGYNYRMDEMSAALGHAQLARIASFLRARRAIARAYTRFLSAEPLLCVPREARGCRSSWFLYVVLVSRRLRDRVIAALEKRGIAAKPYFPSIHLQPHYRKQFGFRRGDFPVAEEVSDRALALPFYVGLTARDVALICQELLRVLKTHEKHL